MDNEGQIKCWLRRQLRTDRVRFIARAVTHPHIDGCSSFVFYGYRCLPGLPTGISKVTLRANLHIGDTAAAELIFGLQLKLSRGAGGRQHFGRLNIEDDLVDGDLPIAEQIVVGIAEACVDDQGRNPLPNIG